MPTIGDIIKTYREEHGLSLREFSKLCGISHSYIDRLEKGIDPRSGAKVEPTLDTLDKIAKAMNMPLDKLLNQIGYIDIIEPTPDYPHKITARDKKQYLEYIKTVNEAFFMNDEVSEEDKKAILETMNEIFWMAKAMRKKKK